MKSEELILGTEVEGPPGEGSDTYVVWAIDRVRKLAWVMKTADFKSGAPYPVSLGTISHHPNKAIPFDKLVPVKR